MAGMHKQVRTISVGVGAHSSASPLSCFTHRSIAVHCSCHCSVSPTIILLGHPPPPLEGQVNYVHFLCCFRMFLLLLVVQLHFFQAQLLLTKSYVMYFLISGGG